MRFRNFIMRCKFLKAAAKGKYIDLPSDVVSEIQREWSNCFTFRDEEPWESLCFAGAQRIVAKFNWLAPHIGHIEKRISNF